MFKKILVTTDASEYSRHALSIALELAKQFNSEIEILNVIEPLETRTSFINYTFSESQINDIGERVMQTTTEGMDLGSVIINKKTVTGHPATVIIEESKKGFDLIVMGTRGHGPVTGAVIGSKTQRVIGSVSCPVLVVK